MAGTRATRPLRAAVVLALIALALAGASNHELWTYDEPREAELARAMWRSGNFVYTTLGDRPFLEKPPLFSVSVALAFELFGQASAPLARVVAACWAGVSLVAVWAFARRAIGERAGLVAALVLATSGRFFSIAHTILLDNALCAGTTVALVSGWVAARERRRGLAALMGLALAVAFLTKGLVGCGIVGLVLGLDLVLRKDKRGIFTLIGPLPLVCFFVPVLAYTALLYRTGGNEGAAFVKEMLWDNQFGRFLSGYGTRNEHWYVYFKGWPEMLAPWTPLAAYCLVAPFFSRERKAEASNEHEGVERFLLIWAVVPLVLLTMSAGKARNYALPVVPAYALLIAHWWHSSVLDKAIPAWGDVLSRGIAATLKLGALGALIALLFIEQYIPFGERGRFDLFGPPSAPWPHHDYLDQCVVSSVLLVAAVSLAQWRRRAARDISREAGALLLGLLVVAGFLFYSSGYFAERGDLSRSYEGLARDVWLNVGKRRLLLFHANDSWSGTFAFLEDRTTPEFNEQWDPHGEHLLAALGPGDQDVVLAPKDNLERDIPEAKRRDLVVEWEGAREEDQASGERRFILFARRRAP